jgi:D-aminopeptidase
MNAITDVAGVRVGHTTVVRDAEGSSVRTGVTTVWPNATPWRRRVYAATSVLNGFGELIGIVHVGEWGLLMSPIVMTSSLAIGRAYDATARWIYREDPEIGEHLPMPVVTECDDSYLNDALSFPLADEDVFSALAGAAEGRIAEGCVGSGTGMQCFDFKGGIGTASRVLDDEHGGYTVGALVMTNYGSRPDLMIQGVPVGQEITDLMPGAHQEGSCIVIVATDAPLLPHQLRRTAVRAGLGLGRMGSIAENGSGEIQIAFSTANELPLDPGVEREIRAVMDGDGGALPGAHSPLFGATVEAVEEAVLNSLFMAETTIGHEGYTLHALPLERTLEILELHGRLG